MSAEPAAPIRHAGLLRRLGAIVYDALILLALVMFVTALVLVGTGGQAVTPGTWWYTALLVGVCVLFFVWCWTHGGQTLGMRAWRVRVTRPDGGPVGWGAALTRAGAALLSWALLGLGFLWALFDREQCAWHDRLSRTRLVRTA